MMSATLQYSVKVIYLLLQTIDIKKNFIASFQANSITLQLLNNSLQSVPHGIYLLQLNLKLESDTKIHSAGTFCLALVVFFYKPISYLKATSLILYSSSPISSRFIHVVLIVPTALMLRDCSYLNSFTLLKRLSSQTMCLFSGYRRLLVIR